LSAGRGGLGREFGGTLVSTVLPAAAGVLSGIALARTLEPAGRGEFASLLIWPTMFALLGDLGVGFALTYLVSREPARRDALWSVGLVVALGWGSALAAVAVALFAPRLALTPPAHTGLGIALAAVPFALLSHVHACLLLGLGRLRASNVLRAAAIVLYALGVASLALLGRGSVLTYAIAWAAATAVVGLAGLAYFIRSVGARWTWEPALHQEVRAYGARVYVGGLAAQATLRLDQMLMSAMSLVAPLGIYAVAVAVASGVGPVFAALAVVVLHRATRAGADARPHAEIRRILGLSLLVGLPLVAAGVALAPVVVPFVFGEPYRPSVLPAQVLLVAAFFQGMNAILGNALRAIGRPGRSSIGEGVGCAVTVALLLVLLPRYGALGAAAASLAAYALVTLIQFRSVAAAERG
jgi:O-antigen/teichoic acid export membrane protein